MTTARFGSKARPFYIDSDGWMTRYKREDDIDTDTFDFTDELHASGETISSVQWIDVSGPTLGTATAATGDGGANLAVTSTVTKTGEAVLEVTTSGSRVLEFPIRWESSDQALRTADYR